MAGKERREPAGAGAGCEDVYPALGFRRPLWSWVGGEGRGEEEEWRRRMKRRSRRRRRNRGRGPGLHLKLSNEIYKEMKLCGSNITCHETTTPLPPLRFKETEECYGGWDTSSSGGQTVQQEVVRVKEDRMTTAMMSPALNSHLAH